MTPRKQSPSRSHLRAGARQVPVWVKDEERATLLEGMARDGHKHLGPWLIWLGLQRAARSGRTTP